VTALEMLFAASAQFETPVAVVNDQVRQRNLDRMQRLAKEHGLRLRPHAKTHKSVTVARRQIDGGAIGLTTATLQEAEIFADRVGVQDLLLAHPPVGEPKLRRLRELSTKIARLAVAVDSVEVAVTLPGVVEVLWEVDTGLHRLGTPPGEPTVRSVRDLVRAIGMDRFRGLMTHGGHAYRAANDAQLLQASHEEADGLTHTADMLRNIGIDVRELSIGSTPTTRYLDRSLGATEMRPGTYVYGDANQVQLGSQMLDDCALAVVASIVSTPEPTRAVIDAGSKALSADLRVSGVTGFGIVLGAPQLRLDRLSEEHGVLTSDEPTGLRIGDRIAIVPTHACTTINLHRELLVIDETGHASWEPVDVKGWRRADG
jgi:D-serine deaminase-like pyridoxal phosphate-dependent protein